MEKSKILDYCLYCDGNEVFCGLASDKINGFCNKHQEFINEKNKYITIEKNICVKIIKEYLNKVEDTIGKTNKAHTVNEMFEFICKHKKFIYDHKSFANTVIDKLYDFQQDEKNLINADKYIKILFPGLCTDEQIQAKSDEDTIVSDCDKTIKIAI